VNERTNTQKPDDSTEEVIDAARDLGIWFEEGSTNQKAVGTLEYNLSRHNQVNK
jgi:hypothetical protein